ncbi:MAG: response regulator [Kiritimatiellae bacterium]|nr:response regulator [Kiritimatiellia bacterium]
MAKILIVDDDPNILIVIQRLLESNGHACVTAESGLKALELIKGDVFNLIITDMRMPNMDGLTLLRKLKKDEPSIPVILITAYASNKTAIESVKRGVFDYVVKPFQANDLLATVKRALDTDKDHARAVDRYSGDNPAIRDYLGSWKTESRERDDRA